MRKTKLIRLICLLVLPGLSCSLSAQDSIIPPSRMDSIQVYRFHISHLDSTTDRNAIWLDTVFHAFQNYDPLLQSEDFSQTLGNIGLAHQNLLFTPTASLGFDMGSHHLDGYKLNNQTLNYYSSMLPFTDLKYATGSRKEQYFHVIHSHNIKKQLTIAAQFHIINALGRRSFRQKADDINSCFTAYYNTRNNRYGFYAHYYYNRLKTMENGGILVDSLYEQFREGRNITQFAYGLFNALNTYKENAWFLKQYVDLDFRKEDTVTGKRKGLSLGRFILTTFYSKPRYIYTDQDAASGYYNVAFNDSSNVADSVWFKKLENSLDWCSNEKNGHGEPSFLRVFAGIKHSYLEVHEAPQNFYFSQFTAHAGMKFNITGALAAEIKGSTILGGYNDGEMEFGADASYLFGKEGKGGRLRLSGQYSQLKAPWTAHYFYGNYFRWDYSFLNQKMTEASVSYHYPNLAAQLNWYQINNLIYFDQFALPRQNMGGTVNVLSLFVKKDIIWGKFRLDNKIILQYSDKDELVRLPLLTASQAYYVTFDMFKKALRVQTGIEAWYNTPYYADAWMPATRQFYLQNERKVGNYVYIDVFLNLKIKRAFLFLALDHANSGLFGYTYYTTPHHPSADRSFRFGVSWLFHD